MIFDRENVLFYYHEEKTKERPPLLYHIESGAVTAEISVVGGVVDYRFPIFDDFYKYASVFIIEGVKMAFVSEDMKNWKPCLELICYGERMTAREFIKKDDEIRRAHGKE